MTVQKHTLNLFLLGGVYRPIINHKETVWCPISSSTLLWTFDVSSFREEKKNSFKTQFPPNSQSTIKYEDILTEKSWNLLLNHISYYCYSPLRSGQKIESPQSSVSYIPAVNGVANKSVNVEYNSKKKHLFCRLHKLLDILTFNFASILWPTTNWLAMWCR